MIYALIAPTTAEATSPSFTAIAKNDVSICCNALTGTETITLQIYDSANNIWKNALYNNKTYQIDEANNFMSIALDTQIYRIVKSVTAVAVGVNLNSDSKINGLNEK